MCLQNVCIISHRARSFYSKCSTTMSVHWYTLLPKIFHTIFTMWKIKQNTNYTKNNTQNKSHTKKKKKKKKAEKPTCTTWESTGHDPEGWRSRRNSEQFQSQSTPPGSRWWTCLSAPAILHAWCRGEREINTQTDRHTDRQRERERERGKELCN